ncbi:MAG: signal peptide peptidase SppA [bacterium]|jgi:signal peptide peptidase SppA|nr:signal peptide peptidase SppA [bacterium]
MKKSTGIALLFSFVIAVIVLVALFVGLVAYLMQGSTPNILRSKRLALVRVEGVIYDVEDIIDEIKDYQEDHTIKGIILRVNSPGGAIGPSQDLYDCIKETQEDYGKVVVASFASVAASGGYYIACSADRIVSSQGTLTGSIGVYSKFLNTKGLFEKLGIGYETVKAGKYKDFGSMERELSPEERAMMQGVIDDSYMQFVEVVFQGRKKALAKLLMDWDPTQSSETYPFTEDVTSIIKGFQQDRQNFLDSGPIQDATAAEAVIAAATMEIESNATPSEETEFDPESGIENVSETEPESASEIENASETEFIFAPDEDTLLEFTKTIAEGKVYTGRQAKEIGLVDELGTLDDAIRLCAELVGISGDPTVIERTPPELSFLDLLTQKLSTLTQQKVETPLHYEMTY